MSFPTFRMVQQSPARYRVQPPHPQAVKRAVLPHRRTHTAWHRVRPTSAVLPYRRTYPAWHRVQSPTSTG